MDDMTKWRGLAEERIQQAFEAGKFNGLPGAGRPIKWRDESFVDHSQSLAWDLLRNNGFDPPFIEARKDIEAGIEAARQALERAWRQYAFSAAIIGTDLRWQQAIRDFREALQAINRSIRDYNLTAPHPGFHLRHLDADKEIVAVSGSAEP